MIARVLRATWRRLRWLVALGVIAFWLWIFADHAGMQPMRHSLPFELWYGNWHDVLVASALFLSFVLALAWPRGRAEWRATDLFHEVLR